MVEKIVITVSNRCLDSKGLYLVPDQWNDWYEFRTAFWMYYVDSSGHQTCIGWVKVGKDGLRSSSHVEQQFQSKSFVALGDEFYSLGQDADYYENINKLFSTEQGESILKGMRDMAFDPSIYERYASDYCMKESILRSVSSTTLKGEFNRLAHGKARLTKYDFDILLNSGHGNDDRLRIAVMPESVPPTNVYAIIGSNGTGKTSLLKGILSAFGDVETDDVCHVSFMSGSVVEKCNNLFSNIVCVGFSAFDNLCSFGQWARDSSKNENIHPVGLDNRGECHLEQNEQHPSQEQRIEQLAGQFSACCTEIQSSNTRKRMWRDAISTLNEEASVRNLINTFDEGNEESINDRPIRILRAIEKTFSSLSSGHKIVLLTIVELIRYVEEKTLVLIDEPEMHLHPPLLSVFIRALSSILIDRNGVAILATHSPVVLQEIPSTCAWMISRSDDDREISPLTIETYGADINSLMREVFGFEIDHTGFHSTLRKALQDNDWDFESAESSFSGHLGNDARAFLKMLSVIYGGKRER